MNGIHKTVATEELCRSIGSSGFERLSWELFCRGCCADRHQRVSVQEIKERGSLFGFKR